jgi:hypothetical protein
VLVGGFGSALIVVLVGATRFFFIIDELSPFFLSSTALNTNVDAD